MSDEPRRPGPPPGGAPYTGETRAIPRPARTGPPSGGPPRPPPAAPAPRRPAAAARRRGWPVGRTLLALLGLLAIGLLLGYWQISRLASQIVVADPRGAAIASPLVGATVLIIGVDERPDRPEEGVRSDTLILARLDAVGRWASMLSVPRDTLADLPGLGQRKINAAYGYAYASAAELYGPGVSPQQAGMAYSAETVAGLLALGERGLGVDYVAQINFAGFAGLIDALGGVSIDVPRLIVDDAYPTPDYGTMRVEFQPGPQRMDGERALIYARTRHADSDFGRAERQQQVARAVLAELQARGWLGRLAALPGLLAAAGGDGGSPPVLTTLPIDRPDVLLGLLGLAGGLDPATMGQHRLSPESVAVTEIGSDLLWDPAGLRELVGRWLTPPSEASEAARVQVLNGADVAGLAAAVSLELEAAGFTLLPPDNAPPGDYERTVVYMVGEAPLTARRLAAQLGAELAAGPPAGAVGDAELVVILGRDRAP